MYKHDVPRRVMPLKISFLALLYNTICVNFYMCLYDMICPTNTYMFDTYKQKYDIFINYYDHL